MSDAALNEWVFSLDPRVKQGDAEVRASSFTVSRRPGSSTVRIEYPDERTLRELDWLCLSVNQYRPDSSSVDVAVPAAERQESTACATCPRDANGRIERSQAARRAFMRMTGYADGRPGYIIDHKIPLACGGTDDPSNMQWQTIEEAKRKDKVERINCQQTGGRATPRDEAYWSGRLKTLETQLDRDQTYAEALQSRINALTTDFVNRADPVQRAVIERDHQKAIAELNRLKDGIEKDKKAIADFSEEARRAGVASSLLR